MKKFAVIVLLLVLVAALAAPALTERAARGEDLGDVAGELRELLEDKGGELFSWLKEYFASHETGEIAEHLQTIFRETAQLSDEELDEEIRAAAEGVSLHLSDAQVERVRKLCRKYETMDTARLRETLESWKERLSSLGSVEEVMDRLGEAKDTFTDAAREAGTIWDSSRGLLDNLRRIFRDFAGAGE